MAFLIPKSLYLITFKEEMKYRSKEQEFHMFL